MLETQRETSMKPPPIIKGGNDLADIQDASVLMTRRLRPNLAAAPDNPLVAG